MAEQKKAETAQATTEVAQENEFASLLNQEFRPKSDRAAEEINSAVQTLAEYALKDTNIITTDAVASIEALIAQIDKN